MRTTTITEKPHLGGESIRPMVSRSHSLCRAPQGHRECSYTIPLAEHPTAPPHNRLWPSFRATPHFSTVLGSLAGHLCHVRILHHVLVDTPGGEQQIQLAYRLWQASREALENSSCNQMPMFEQTTTPGLSPPHWPCKSSYSALPFADINIHLRVLKTPSKPTFGLK